MKKIRPLSRRGKLIAAGIILALLVGAAAGWYAFTRTQTFSLSTTPMIKITPMFQLVKISGFTAQTQTGIASRNLSNSFVYTKSSQPKCTANFYTSYLDANLSRGDDAALSQSYLKNLTAATGSGKIATPVTIKTTTGDELGFISVPYTSKTFSADPNRRGATDETINSRIAVRAINVTREYTVPAQNGKTTLRGLPILIAQYQCIGTKVSGADWQKLLDAQRVDFN